MACASLHQVNLEGLSAEKNQMFYLRSVKFDCNKIFPILGKCSADCQLAILNNIPTADITKILSDAYGINIAQDHNLSIFSYRISNDGQRQEHMFRAAKISMGKLKVSFHIEDLLMANGDADTVNTCFFFEDKADYTHYIDVEFTIQDEFMTDKSFPAYDISARASAYAGDLIRHRDKIEKNDSQFNNIVDKLRDGAVKMPPALERDIKAYRSSNKL